MKHEQGWTLGRKAMVGNLITSHIWGTFLVLAAIKGNTSQVISDMFASCGFIIFSTLGVLVGGKAWKDFMPYMRGGQTTKETSYVSTSVSDKKPVVEA